MSRRRRRNVLARSSHGVQRGSTTKQHTRKNHVSLVFLSAITLASYTMSLYTSFIFFPPHFFSSFFLYLYIYKFSLSPLISHGQLLYYYYPLSLSAERQRRETREMAKARISRIYTWSAEQLWSEFYVSVDLTNGQLTPNNNTPLLTQALSGTSKSLPFLFGFRSFMYRFINLSLHR